MDNVANAPFLQTPYPFTLKIDVGNMLELKNADDSLLDSYDEVNEIWNVFPLAAMRWSARAMVSKSHGHKTNHRRVDRTPNLRQFALQSYTPGAPALDHDAKMGNMEEGMEIWWQTRMDMMVDQDAGTMDLSDLLDAKRRSLCDLPGELIGMIAERLDKKTLRILRRIENPVIRKAIDHVWADAHFSYLRCLTSDGPSIASLGEIASSRLAKRIRTIEIRFHLICEPEKSQNGVSPCMEALLEPAVQYTLEKVLTQAVNLRKIIIGGPNGRVGLYDTRLVSGLPWLGDSDPVQNLEFSYSYAAGHQHIVNTTSVCQLFTSIIHTIQQYSQRGVQEFSIVEFHDTKWKSALIPTDWVSTTKLTMPALQNVTTLNLEFEMFTSERYDTILGITKAIEKNASLRVLKLRTGKRSVLLFQLRSEYWAPLLSLLGTDPPFRLHTLMLDGLTTSITAPTLDRVIAVHASTLRRVVFAHLNFHLPNSLRAFSTELSKTKINYFATSWFFLHERSFVLASSLQYRTVPDEALQWEEGFEDIFMAKDESYRDWIIVDWEVFNHDRMLVYDNRDGSQGEGWMRMRFLDMVRMIDDGAIRDGH